jgi:hypothetical protein
VEIEHSASWRITLTREKCFGAVERLDAKTSRPQHQCDGTQVCRVVVDDVDDWFASTSGRRYIL